MKVMAREVVYARGLDREEAAKVRIIEEMSRQVALLLLQSSAVRYEMKMLGPKKDQHNVEITGTAEIEILTDTGSEP